MTDGTSAATGEAGGWLERVRASVDAGMNKAIAVQEPMVLRLAQRVGYNDEAITPAQAITALEKYYRNTVVAMGTAAGASAFLPGVGTAAGAALNVAEVGTYLEATMVYCLTLAHIHDVHVHDLDRRRLLLYAVVLGDSGSETVTKIAERFGKHWGKKITSAIPAQAVRSANKALSHNFITKWGTKQGVLVLGREIPLGIGAGVGAGGNWLIARGTIKAARGAFGPPPKHWPERDYADR